MSHFSEGKCQGCLQEKEQKTYCVVMRLCDDCARVKGHFIRVWTLEKKVVFNCHRHIERKALAFCHGHEVTVCLECLSSHIGNECRLLDLNVEVKERRTQLGNLVERCKSKAEEFKQFNVEVDIRSDKIENHFAEIEDEIRNVTSQEKKEVEDIRDRLADQINRHAEKEIDRIRQEQYESLKENDRDAEKKMDKIKEKERKLDQIRAMFARKISKLKSYLQHTLDSVEKAESIDDEGMLQADFKQTVVSLASVINRQVNTCSVDKLVEAAKLVSLVRGDDDNERIDVPVERWEEQNGITRTTGLGEDSYMMGAISEGEVILKNTDDGSVHILNIHSGDTREVISGKTPYDIYSYAALHDGRVVCGTRFGEIVVYDHDWNPLRTIHLDKLGKSIKIRPVSLCTDTNDQVFASTSNSKPTIHVFDLQNGEFIRSIDLNMVKVRSISELHRLSSSDIALRISSVEEECTDVRILDKLGYLRSIHHLHNKNIMSMAVDAPGHRIFMMLLDHDSDSDYFDMAVLSSSGTLEVDIELPFESCTLAEMCFMPETNALVIHYGGTTTVFKQTNLGLEEIIDNIDREEI